MTALVVSGCSLSSSSSNEDWASGGPAIPKGLDAFYKQKVTWKSCKKGKNGDLRCAQVKVPLDYTKPKGKTITIAMAKMPATGKKPMGTLFVNPGGPGASGIDMAGRANTYFSDGIREKYDIVGFDPRGVGESTAVQCYEDDDLGKFLDSSFDLSDPEQAKKEQVALKAFAKACEEKSGELLPFVGTESAARDMDVMRQLVGDPKFNYVGFSYGTSLGGQYAELFPKNVGRMILDGAVDVTRSGAQHAYDQTLGFETVLKRYAKSCVDSGRCVLGSTVDQARQKVRSLLETAKKTPFKTTDPARPLNDSMLFTGIIGMLYSNATWPTLTQAFEQVIQRDNGAVFQRVADLYNSREPDGSFSDNSSEANRAINCADYPASSPDEYKKLSEQAKANAPVFGSSLTEGTDLCSLWPYRPKKAVGPYKAKGSASIVVVGTRNDPATPYAWAKALHRDLENSVLVTWEGEGHTAYSRAGACIQKPLDRYLLTGRAPKDGLTCPA